MHNNNALQVLSNQTDEGPSSETMNIFFSVFTCLLINLECLHNIPRSVISRPSQIFSASRWFAFVTSNQTCGFWVQQIVIIHARKAFVLYHFHRFTLATKFPMRHWFISPSCWAACSHHTCVLSDYESTNDLLFFFYINFRLESLENRLPRQRSFACRFLFIIAQTTRSSSLLLLSRSLSRWWFYRFVEKLFYNLIVFVRRRWNFFTSWEKVWMLGQFWGFGWNCWDKPITNITKDEVKDQACEVVSWLIWRSCWRRLSKASRESDKLISGLKCLARFRF